MKLHIGCGQRNFGSEWDHLDGGFYPHVKYKVRDLDFLPFKDNTYDLVYASHVLEYFDQEQAVKVLTEWMRVLKPGGVLRLAVPDFQAMVKLYYEQGTPLERLVGPLYGKMAMAETTIYHKTVYDFRTLHNLLVRVGFKEPKYWNWAETEHSQFDDHSQAYLPHMDKENGTLISLNLQCNKAWT